MMHYYMIAIVNDGEDIERHLLSVMAPYNEDLECPPRKIRCRSRFGCSGEFDGYGPYYLSTRNQRGKWDWWRVGGRWDGNIQGKPRCSSKDGGFNFGDEHSQLRHNKIGAREWLAGNHQIPHAIMLPDGTWSDQGWGNHKIDEETWVRTVKANIEAHPEAMLVGIDYHT